MLKKFYDSYWIYYFPMDNFISSEPKLYNIRLSENNANLAFILSYLQHLQNFIAFDIQMRL